MKETIKAIIIPFATSPHIMLMKTMKNTQPNLFLGTNGHGSNLSRLLTPKPADNIEEINVAKKKVSKVSITSSLLKGLTYTSK